MGLTAADVVAVVLAAGESRRMRSATSKVLHRVGGMPAIERVVRALLGAGVGRIVIVVGRQGELVRQALAPYGVSFAEQARAGGTADAVRAAEAAIGQARHVLIVYGDGAVLTPELLGRLLQRHLAGEAAATLLTGRMDDPAGYGRVLRDAEGRIRGIVEEADATAAERQVREWNTGVGCYRWSDLRAALGRVGTDNAKGEAYLTDVPALLAAAGHAAEALCDPDARDAVGVDDRADLAAAEAILRQRVLQRLWRDGVTVLDPATTFVDERAEIDADTVIGPMTIIEGPCRIGAGCQVGPGAHLRDSEMGAGAAVWHSVVEGSRIGAACRVGPFAHVRPGSTLGDEAEVGNFAEVKNTELGAGSKAHHHCYLGDATLGERVNVGAGVVTVNYDGRRKHRTTVAAGAFLGCNVNLIAPLTVGAGAYVGAGSTLTEPVPAGALALARERQVNKPGWAARRSAASQPAPPGADLGGGGEGGPAEGGEPANTRRI